MLAPFPAEELADLIEGAKHVLVVENNFSGQLKQLIKLHVGDVLAARASSRGMTHVASLVKYNGKPFLPSEIVARAEEELKHAYAC